MKKTIKLFGIIAFAAVIMVSTVLISCGSGSGSISGTYTWDDDPEYTITFTGKNYTGKYGNIDLSGSFEISNNQISVERGDFRPIVFTIIDKNTIRDHQGDDWVKKN